MSADAPTCPLMELTGATIGSDRRGKVPVLRDVNWRVANGDFWVIGALPGAGKSALLGTAAGLTRPVAGSHRLFGEELADFEETGQWKYRRRVGLVFENGGQLFNQLDVRENVALPLRYHHYGTSQKTGERLHELLQATDLLPHAGHLPRDLSRGPRQRAGLARALALEPEVLFLDNPLAGLDPRQIRWWLDFLAKLHTGSPVLHGRPLSLAVTCEDFRPWLGLGTRFALIHEHRWVSLGNREELKRCDDPVVQELLGNYLVLI